MGPKLQKGKLADRRRAKRKREAKAACPRPTHPIHGKGYRVTRDDYNAIFQRYAKGASIRVIAEELGLSHPTVSKYIKEGDPARGWEPITRRMDRVRARAVVAADTSAVEFRSGIYKRTQDMISESVDVAQLALLQIKDYRKRYTVTMPDGGVEFVHFKPGKGRGMPAVPGWSAKEFESMVGSAERAARLVQTWQVILRDMTQWAEGSDDQEFKGWTEAELEAYIKDGSMPARLVATGRPKAEADAQAAAAAVESDEVGGDEGDAEG